MSDVIRSVIAPAALLLLLTAAAPAAEPRIETIADLWAGFDPRALPLDVEVVKAWDEGETHLEMVYFTGEEFDGVKTRVFGYLGRPKKVEGKIPGVLHIHGGGQTAVPDWPRFWASRGYACLSFDFCGNTNLPELGPGCKREHYTRGRQPETLAKADRHGSPRPGRDVPAAVPERHQRRPRPHGPRVPHSRHTRLGGQEPRVHAQR